MNSPIHVLLVEDNEADAFLTREMLEASKLFVDIHTVSDGATALAYLFGVGSCQLNPKPDLILLDLNLPGMNGIEVLRELNQHETLRSIPVVVLTSSDAERDIATSYQIGANCYVTKPVGLGAFQDIVRAVESFWFTVVKLP